MKTRVTLTMDPQLHARAKRLARARRTTVSGLFEGFVRSSPDGGGGAVDAMIGSAELRREAKGKDVLLDALLDRWMSRRS